MGEPRAIKTENIQIWPPEGGTPGRPLVGNPQLYGAENKELRYRRLKILKIFRIMEFFENSVCDISTTEQAFSIP